MDDIWKEIEALQAQLQASQDKQHGPRLSERNCIEIVSKLMRTGAIELYPCSTGKEYVTPQQLVKEIKSELKAAGGRINIVDLQSSLSVDTSVVELKVREIVKRDKTTEVIVGQLISREYKETLAEMINEHLHDQGSTSIGELSKLYDLPTASVDEVVRTYLGSRIHGQRSARNQSVLLTEFVIGRHRSIIRGALNAATRPVPLSDIVKRHPDQLQESLVMRVLDELIASGQVAGFASSNRVDKAIFTPNAYTEAQRQYVASFLEQNGYVDYGILRGQGIGDAKAYIRKAFPDEQLVYLSSCAMRQREIQQYESCFDEALATDGSIDMTHYLPPNLDESDREQLLGLMSANMKHQWREVEGDESGSPLLIAQWLIDAAKNNLHATTEALANELAPVFAKFLMSKQASKAEKQSTPPADSTDGDSSRKKGGKGAKGAKGRRRRDDDDEDAPSSSSAMPLSPIPDDLREKAVTTMLGDKYKDCAPEVVRALAQLILPGIHKDFQASIQQKAAQLAREAAGSKKRNVTELRDTALQLLAHFKLCDKGLACFAHDDDLQTQLRKHLLRTLGGQIETTLLQYCEAGQLVRIEGVALDKSEDRKKVIAKIKEPTHSALTALHDSLASTSTEVFLENLEECFALPDISIMLRKADRKNDRAQLLQHLNDLREQLEATCDLATALHRACLLLLYSHSKSVIHASGKFVPQLVAHLSSRVATPSDAQVLNRCLKGAVAAQRKDEGEKLSELQQQQCIVSLRELVLQHDPSASSPSPSSAYHSASASRDSE